MTVTPAPLRTLQLGNDWPTERVGGLNRYFADLLLHLPAAGVEARGLVVGPEKIHAETAGVVTAFARSTDPLYKRLWLARTATLKALQQEKVDLLVSHFALYTAPLAGLAARHPTVVHFHGPWAAESGVEGAASLSLRAKRLLESGVYRRARQLIVLSQAFQKELVTRYNIEEERIRIVPGGINTVRFNAELSRDSARQQLGWPTDRPILLAVRRLVRRMGLENLVEAMRTIITSVPEALLLLGGKGPLTAELQQLIESRGLQQHVRLLGRIEEQDLPLAYRAADLTVVPTQALEGFGMITLESLASGTPVFVTPIGGLPEVVRPFAPQCVFADTRTETMASVLEEALRTPELLPSAEACRAYALNHFSWPAIASRVAEVYRQALL